MMANGVQNKSLRVSEKSCLLTTDPSSVYVGDELPRLARGGAASHVLLDLTEHSVLKHIRRSHTTIALQHVPARLVLGGRAVMLIQLGKAEDHVRDS